MRYEWLEKQAKKQNYDNFELVAKEYATINEECDKYSNYIAKTDMVTLLKTVTIEITNDIVIKLNKIPMKERDMQFNQIYVYMCSVYNEILREKLRNNVEGSSNNITKMVIAYRRLSSFVQNILNVLAAKEPCDISQKDGNVILIYKDSFDKQNERINRMIMLQNQFWHYMYQPSDEVQKEYMKRPKTNLDVYREQAFQISMKKAPWMHINNEAYDKDNLNLLGTHSLVAAYCSRAYQEPFIRYICSHEKLYPKKLYWSLKKNAIIGSHGEDIPSPPHYVSPEMIDRYLNSCVKRILDEAPLGEEGAKDFPIIVRTKESLLRPLQNDDQREAILKLIMDTDAKLSSEKIDALDIYKHPIVKCTVNGQELYVYIPMILSNALYTDTAYSNINIAEHQTVSAYMEQLISSKLMKIDNGLIDANAQLGNKQLRLFSDSKSEGEFDCFIIDPKHKCAILIEYKHREYFIRDAFEARNVEKNMIEKAQDQIHNLLTLIKCHPRELETYMALPTDILSGLDIYPLIVSSSMERDGEYPLRPVVINGRPITKVKKISYFELERAMNLNSPHESEQTRILPQVIEIIDSGKVLEMLESSVNAMDTMSKEYYERFGSGILYNF